MEPKDVQIKSFKPRSLNGEVSNDYTQVKERFGSFASTDKDANPHFNLHSESKKYLGVEAEEKSRVTDLVTLEVNARLAELRDQAYQEGFAKGRAEGHAAAENDYRGEVQPQFERFIELIQGFENAKHDVYVANEQFLIQLIFQISKNIIMGELKTDRQYVKRLTSQIIEKLGAKENIRLKVSRADYENVDQLRDFLKTQFPDLKNVQIEAVDELALGGVKVETDLSRINASVEAQFKSTEAALSGDL